MSAIWLSFHTIIQTLKHTHTHTRAPKCCLRAHIKNEVSPCKSGHMKTTLYKPDDWNAFINYFNAIFCYSFVQVVAVPCSWVLLFSYTADIMNNAHRHTELCFLWLSPVGCFGERRTLRWQFFCSFASNIYAWQSMLDSRLSIHYAIHIWNMTAKAACFAWNWNGITPDKMIW